MEEGAVKSVEDVVKEEMEKIASRAADIDKRIAEFVHVHEDVVYIHRYDNIKTLTFLAMADGSAQNRMRTSWYGRIVAVSTVDSGDDIREKKKQIVKKDDVIIFNPDAAYSLNVADFEEIWIVHIDSVLNVDKGYNYIKAIESNERKRAEIEQARMRNAIQQVQAEAQMAAIKQKTFEQSMSNKGNGAHRG